MTTGEMSLTTAGIPAEPRGTQCWEFDCSRTPTEMCVPESENNVASGELGPALQMNALKQDDILSHLLCFFVTAGSGAVSVAACRLIFINEAILLDVSPYGPPSRQWWSSFWGILGKSGHMSLNWGSWTLPLWDATASFIESPYLRGPQSSLDEQTLLLLCSTYCLQVHGEPR